MNRLKHDPQLEFECRIQKSFVQGSGVDSDLFDSISEFHRDLEFLPCGDPHNPIHEGLGWVATRFGRRSNPNRFACFLRNEDGSLWQAVVSNEQDPRGYQYYAPKGNGNRAYLPQVTLRTWRKIAKRYGIQESAPWLRVSARSSRKETSFETLESGLHDYGTSDAAWDGEIASSDATYLDQSLTGSVGSDKKLSRGFAPNSDQSIRNTSSSASMSMKGALSFGASLSVAQLPSNTPVPEFWDFIADHPEIAIAITEGAKKALSLLSQGFVAIAVYGCSCLKSPNLDRFCTGGRRVIIALDQDTKLTTRRKVGKALFLGGIHLQQQGAKVFVATWHPEQGKGIDDLLVTCGSATVEAAITGSDPFAVWKLYSRPDLTRNPDIEFNRRYLGALSLPEKGVIGIRSAKGTGKTELLSSLCQQAKTVLYVGHRVSLIRNSAGARLGLMTYQETGQGFNPLSSPKLAITFDSLHKLTTEGNRYDLVVLDEAVQGLDHLVNSATLKKHRAEVLAKFEYFIGSAGRVLALDADLNDEALNYLQSLRGGEDPFVVVNRYLNGGRQIEQHPSAERLTVKATQILAQGGKLYIFTTSQKEALKLEKVLRKRYPDIRLRVVHGDNSMEKDTQDFIENINERIVELDCLIVSPSLGTGVSIDADHFTHVLGFIHGGSCSAHQISQGLFRVRPALPMAVWVDPHPIGGYRDEGISRLKRQALDKHRTSGILLKINPATGEKEAINENFLTLWASINSRRNASLNSLREATYALLKMEGHTLVEPELDPVASIAAKQERQEAKEEIELERALAISQAKDLTDPQADILERKTHLSYEQRCHLEKHRIHKGYGMEVTPDLVEKDDEGRLLPQLSALHDLLSDPEVAESRDLANRERCRILTDHSHHALKRAVRIHFGLLDVLNITSTTFARSNNNQVVAVEFSPEQVAAVAEKVRQSLSDVKTILGLTIPKGSSDYEILGRLLAQLGLRTLSRRAGSDENRTRLYRLDPESWNFAMQVLAHKDRQAGLGGGSRFTDRIMDPEPSPPVDPSPGTKLRKEKNSQCKDPIGAVELPTDPATVPDGGTVTELDPVPFQVGDWVLCSCHKVPVRIRDAMIKNDLWIPIGQRVQILSIQPAVSPFKQEPYLRFFCETTQGDGNWFPSDWLEPI